MKKSRLKTRYFILGYCYAAVIMETFETPRCDGYLTQLPFKTNMGDLRVGINRGIAPMCGCTAFGFIHDKASAYDIYKGWVNDKVWKICKKYLSEDMKDEIRVSLDDLCDIIEECEGIDFLTMQEQHKISTT